MRGFKRHVWLFENRLEIKALGACNPAPNRPVIICLSWRKIACHPGPQNPEEYAKQEEQFKAFIRSVMDEVRELFKGVCEVVFIGRSRLNPGHMCHYLADDGNVIF
jgi:hypothetical protein